MAFQQPQHRPQPQRASSSANPNSKQPQTQSSPTRKRSVEESQEWILFAGNGDVLSTTSQTPRTATYLSDLGSLETHVRSQQLASTVDGGDIADILGAEDDEDIELDSLDDGLHAFHHPFSTSSNQLDVSAGTILPTHDGLGTFPSSAGLQEQLWQFERYNPHRRRHARRKSSIQVRIDELEAEHELHPEDERIARVEKWRLEQSRAVLEEIERETKRRQRRMSRASGATGSVDLQRMPTLEIIEEQRTDASVDEKSQASFNTVEPDQEPPQEGFWQRITKRVIQDLIGLDDNTLSVIFGEQLVQDPSPTPTKPSPIAQQAAQDSQVTFQDTHYSWEVKLLDRIARELGVLVHQLSEQDGRAFSSYIRTIEQEPDYAGIPIPRRESLSQTQPLRRRKRRLSSRDHVNIAPSDSPLFRPTIPPTPNSPLDAPDTSLWGIEEESPSTPPAEAASAIAAANDAAAKQRQEQEYWERNIDVRMIFSYLRRRFSSTPVVPTANTPATTMSLNGPLPASWATNATALKTSQESLRRAEIIKRQHPLVSRAAATAQSRRRDSLIKRHHIQTLMQRHTNGSSSCASQSTKRSRQSRSASLVSSRNYWDLGGSYGSVSSGHAMSSALGGWGEV